MDSDSIPSQFSPISILLVEDNYSDIQVTRVALRKARIANTLDVVENGEEALDYLFHRPPYESSKLPDLILLDINMPKMSGIEALKIIKQSPETRAIPIIMLTSSNSERDIVESYKNYANSYITKPFEVAEFFNVVRRIEDFWFGLVKLPHAH